VSAQIVALEASLGVKLFDRIGRTIALTAAGQVVLEAAAEILRHVDDMRQALHDLEGLRRGRLRVGASLLIGVYLLPEILGRFKEQHPQIDLALRIERAHHIIELIMANDLDIGLIGEGAPVTDERLILQPLMRDELVVITPARHRWTESDAIAPAALSGETFIIPARDFATSEVILRRIAAAGLKLAPALELGNIEAVKKAVEAGLGISIVSRCAVQREVDAGTLKALRVRGVPLERQLFYCWRKGKEFSRAAKAFVDFFSANVAAAAT
jgi:DNA-binding transcriptional LysR family regulator